MILLLVLALLLYGRALLPGCVLSPADILFQTYPWRLAAPDYVPANPLISDQALQFHPWLIFAARQVRSGSLPLWNPHAFAGAPFLGNAQSALLFPLTALGYFLPIPTALGLSAILKIWIAGLSMYWFARLLTLEPLPALLGAVVFMFSGPIMVWLGYPLTNVAVWLPLLLATLERLRQTGSWRSTALVAITVAVQFLGGHPETSFHILVVAALYGLYRIPGPGWSRFLVQSVLAGVLGAMAAAAQLLPFLEYLFHSAALASRQGGPVGPLPARGILALLIPNYFGASFTHDFWGPFNYNEISGWAGIAPWVLAPLAGFDRGRRRHSLFFFALAAFSLLVIYDLVTPLARAVSRLPGFSLALNWRFLLVWSFSLAVLSSLGLQSLLERSADQSRGRVQLSKAITLGLLGLVAWGPVRDLAEMLQRGVFPDFTLQWASFLLLLTVATLLVIRAHRARSGPPACAVALIGLELVSLLPTVPWCNPIISTRQFYPATPALEWLRSAPGMFRVILPHANLGAVYGLSDLNGYDAMTPFRFQQLMDTEGAGLRGGIMAMSFQNLLDSPLLDLLNVKYVLLPPAAPTPAPKYRLSYDGPDARIYRNTQVLPRAFLVSAAQIRRNQKEAIALVHERAFDFRREVILQEPVTIPASLPVSAFQTGRVLVERYEPDRVLLRTHSAGSSYLVLSDTYFPGWKVRVDGRVAALLQADGALRAVLLPAGRHRVIFSYEPTSFRAGLGLSAAALLVVAILCLPPRRTVHV